MSNHTDLELERQLTAWAFFEGCKEWIVDAFTDQECRKAIAKIKRDGPQQLTDKTAEYLGVGGGFVLSVIMRDERPPTIALAAESYRRLVDLHKRRTEHTALTERLNTINDYSVPLAGNTKRWVTLDERVNHLRQSMALRGSGMRFGWSYVDDFLGGVLPQKVMVIAAASGAGKSIMAQNMIERLSEQAPGLFFSFEMEEDGQTKREIEVTHGNDPRLTYSYLKDPQFVADYLRDNPLHNCPVVYETMGLDDMEATIKAYREERGACAWCVVDYLDYIDHDPKHETMNMIARKLKPFAKRNDVLLIVLAQIDKLAARTDRKTGEVHKPNGFDILGGIGIQASADYVLCQWQQEGRFYAKWTKARAMHNVALRDIEYRLEMTEVRINEWTPTQE